MDTDFEYILYLKYAIFEGENSQMLFDRKFEEIKKCGKFFWGYGSFDLTPKNLKPLIDELDKKNKKIVAFFSQTKTTLKKDFPRGEQYSHDKKSWFPLPANITTHGKTFAFVFSDLKENNFKLNLFDYKNIVGKKTGINLADYLVYPIHKAMAQKCENKHFEEKISQISYTAILRDIVYIK